MQKEICLVTAASLLFLIACSGGGPDTGTLRVTIYGEEYIEQGIPSEEFVDGWGVEFDTFLITVGQISVSRDESIPPILEVADQIVFDLARPSDGYGYLVDELSGVDTAAYAHVDYNVTPATAGASAGNASQAQVDSMVQSGWSIYMEGIATRGEDVKTFRWGFRTATDYLGCESTASVAPDGIGAVELTIHADHLFYNSLISTDPDVSFDLIASADDGDGEITADELAAVDITALTDYQVGDADVTSLWGFLEAQTHTMGHIDGEGHCGTSSHTHGE